MKTKISRIGKRSLSILLTTIIVVSMMLVGMITSNAVISYWFVSGSFNNWTTSPGSYQLVNNKVTVDMNNFINQEITFKMVAYENGNQWCGKDNTTISTGTEIELGWNAGGDIKFKPTKRYVTFSMDIRNEKNYLTVTESSTDPNVKNWYLSGYIGYDGYSHSDTGVSSPEFKMTQSSSNSNIYTITYPVCGDQYFTVNDGTNVYHPTSANAASGTAAGAPDTTAYGDCWKWFAPAAGGSEITVTWDVSTKTLSWTVTSKEWYISGYLKKAGENYGTVGFSEADYKMTRNPNNSNEYTLTYDAIGWQAVTVNDGTIAYHPANDQAASGTAATLTDAAPGSAPSWRTADYQESTAVTFTWNSSTKVLTWVVESSTTSYTITPSSTTNGSISSDVASAEAGETVTITATPDAGFECTGVTVSPFTTVTDKGDGTYTFKMPASNVTVSATFAKVVESGDYTITKTASAFGTMTVVNASNVKEGTANEGDVITVTVNPVKGYACTGLTVATADVTANDDGTYTFTMPASNVTLTATFEATIVTYNLSGSVSNAVITFSTSKSSSATVAEPGDKVTATITLNSGYICSSFAILDCNDVELSIEKLSSTKYTFIMPESDITATATVTAYTPDTNHTFRVYFKAPSAFAYQPKVSLDGAAQVSMTKGQELGKIYSGALTIYWFYYDFTVDTSETHTLTFKTARTNLNATITDYFINDAYYLAVDNLMSGTEVVDLSQYSGNLEYVRNYYRSATHMVYPYAGASDTTDNTLGFTNINGIRYKMGECIKTGRVSITSATLIQKVSVSAETVDNVQMALLDVNLDGVVDVRDATLTQKYLVSA